MADSHAYLTHKGTKYPVHHMAITMRNESVLRGHYEAIRKFVSDQEGDKVQASILTVANEYPEIFDFVTESGAMNAQAIIKKAASLIKSHEIEYQDSIKDLPIDAEKPLFTPMPEKVALDEAKRLHTEQFTDWLKSNVGVAKILYFTTGNFPTSLAALKYGIAVIKATVDRERTGREVLDLLDSPHEGETISDFWADMSSVEVAHYVNNFCMEIGQ